MDNFTSYKEAMQVAKECDKKLTAYDFHFHNLVEIIHEDGTILHYKSGFTTEWKDWVFVFTEHHGTQVYHKSDLRSWGTYVRRESDKQKDTGYQDKCEFCHKEFKVEDLYYSHHPGNQYDDQKYYVYCEDCHDIVDSKHEALWRKLNETGAWNMEKQCTEPWGFTWGRDDMAHIRKACATIMHEEDIDKWLDTPSPSFRKTPRESIKNGYYEDVYLAIFSMGNGEFS